MAQDVYVKCVYLKYTSARAVSSNIVYKLRMSVPWRAESLSIEIPKLQCFLFIRMIQCEARIKLQINYQSKINY